MKQTNQYYTRTAQVLHWLMAVIFIAAWAVGFFSGNFLSYESDGSFKGDVITLHKNIATPIIFLMVIRLFWRYTHPGATTAKQHVTIHKNSGTFGALGFVFHADCHSNYRLFI